MMNPPMADTQRRLWRLRRHAVKVRSAHQKAGGFFLYIPPLQDTSKHRTWTAQGRYAPASWL